MNWRAVGTASLFAILAIAAIVLHVRRLELHVTGGERTSILIVSKPAKKDALLKEDQLSVRDVPISYLDDRTVRASDKAKVVGMRLERDLDPQQTLSWLDLAVGNTDDRQLSTLLQPGTRAITLSVPAESMNAELLRPGMFVDVISVITERGKPPQSVVLLQKVLVLAIGRETTPDRDPAHRGTRAEEQLVTINITLQDAQLIALAANQGNVIPVVRSDVDTTVAQSAPPVNQLTPKEVALKPLVARGPAVPRALNKGGE